MSFNTKGFLKQKYSARQDAVAIPELKEWFPDGTDPVWTVRSLDASELAQVKDAIGKDKALLGLVEILASATGGEAQEALKKLIGLDGSALSEDYVKRLELLIIGSVDPVCDRALAKKIAAVYPVVFSRLTEKIFQLTGMGAEPGKSSGSGKTPASATP